jgi:hypothetical protein
MITVFGSSTAFTSLPVQRRSYIHRLREKGYEVQSYCMNGYTIWHVNRILPKVLTERGPENTIILHVGACEAITMAASNFLVMTTYWLHYGEVDHYFMAYFVPKMYKASIDLHEGKKSYHNYLTSSEFSFLYNRVLKQLEGYNVLAVGMSKPREESSDIRMAQAMAFDNLIQKACSQASWVKYIDVWKECEGEVVDSNHLTEEGHRRLYESIIRGMCS